MRWSKNLCSFRKQLMLQGRVGRKDGEHRHRGEEGWKSHDQNAGSFLSVRTLFAGMVSLKCIPFCWDFLIWVPPNEGWIQNWLVAGRLAVVLPCEGRVGGCCVWVCSSSCLEKSLFFCKPNLAWVLVVSLGSGVCWHSVSRACGCGPERFAQDNLEDVWPTGALNQCYPTGRARAIGVRSLAQCAACLRSCCNISERKTGDALDTGQVPGVAATAYLICWWIEPLPRFRAAEPIGLPSTNKVTP